MKKQESILEVLRKRRQEQLAAMNKPKPLTDDDIERFEPPTDEKAKRSYEELKNQLVDL